MPCPKILLASVSQQKNFASAKMESLIPKKGCYLQLSCIPDTVSHLSNFLGVALIAPNMTVVGEY